MQAKAELSYVMGNPPFIGYSNQSKEQKQDLEAVAVNHLGKKHKQAGKLDYVSGWFFKSAKFINGTLIECAFVATNSITQGEQVSFLWKPLLLCFGVHLNFAYKSFTWNSEAQQKAHVHCVIIGFSQQKRPTVKLYENADVCHNVDKISPYLTVGETAFIESRPNPICKVPEMVYGNKPVDGGFFSITEEEKILLISNEPNLEQFIKPYFGASEFIHNKKRYCLWLKNATPLQIQRSSFLKERVEAVRKYRLASTKELTRKSADFPMLFQEIRQPDSDYIVVPRVSSETRKYIPLGFMSKDDIPNDAIQLIPEASLLEFGILNSSVHMAWMRAVAGRLELRYRYSAVIVYNNFPWPDLSGNIKNKIETCAQSILEARAKYPDSSLADMYGEQMYLYADLFKAHEANDKAVMEAYGFAPDMTESEIVAELMKLYKKITNA